MKKRILLALALVALLIVGLTGCGRKPKVIGLIVSAPEEVVTEHVDLSKSTVYRIYDSGNIVKIHMPQYRIIENKEGIAASLKNAGVREFIFEDMETQDPNDKTKKLRTSLRIVDLKAASTIIESQDSFLVFRFKELKSENPKEPAKFAFTHNIGYSFDRENFDKMVEVIKVAPSDDNTATEETNVTASAATALLAEPQEKFPIQYKNNTNYNVSVKVDEVESSFNVVVVGGPKPIHAKSANWFDYILVIPVGWLMQLFSFGGIYGLGILFATIIIRSLAWPIYAKTNAMSANMSEAQPELQRIQAKYRGRTDKESQRQMQMETMQVYKKHKIGMGSMFLPFLQMPIFIAMFQTVSRILVPGGYWADKIIVRSFLGIDLTIGMHWTSYILAAIVGGTMILLQLISTRKPKHLKKTAEHNVDEKTAQSQRTMKIFSFVMVIMMVIFAVQNNALALYWIFGNIFSIGQTLIHKELNRRKYEKKQEETLGGILWKR